MFFKRLFNSRETASSSERSSADRLLTPDGKIKLCWAGSNPQTNGLGNLGDSLSPFIIANLAGLSIERTGFGDKTDRLLGIGSIGHSAKRGRAVIWGAGCYRPELLSENMKDTEYEVLAVRGSVSRECLQSAGIQAPPCYGEPAWLLPSMVNDPVEKQYELGVISHISDLKAPGLEAIFKEDWTGFTIPDSMKTSVIFINTWHTPDLKGIVDKIRTIRSCKRIASRSFHGVVIAEAYGIPCIPICSNPKVPQKAFAISEVDSGLLDKRVRDFFASVRKGGEHFYGLRRCKPVNWEAVMSSIDSLWHPVEYDSTPMLNAFPFEIRHDPTHSFVPTHPSLENFLF